MKTGNRKWGRVASDTSRRILELFDVAAAAGWRIEQKTNGWWAYPPDGSRPITCHLSISDVRAYQNTRARFRRAGLQV